MEQTITVRFLGPARDLAGLASAEWPWRPGLTVGALAGLLAEKHPALANALGLRLAVNRAYVALNHVLSPGDEVAVIPPVSGGQDEPRVFLTREAVRREQLVKLLTTHQAGAIVMFDGTVRAEIGDRRPLAALEYEAYPEMAIEQMRTIREAAIRRHGALDAAIVHRLGRLTPGETSIFVAVVAAHRAEAFTACRFIVDSVKADVAIWKKEEWSDGTRNWVDPTARGEGS